MPLSKALIVDDSRTSAAILGKMLTRQGLAWDQVESGEDCLVFLVSASPDIIFMDHMMPGMDGFQAVKAILQQPELRHIPIVMHTSRHSAVYYGQARALGAVGVLQKPAMQQDLIGILERVRASASVTEAAEPALAAAGSESAPPVDSGMAPKALTFDLDAPTVLPPQEPLPQHAPMRAVHSPSLFRRALIVDDSRTSAAVLASMLERHDLISDRVDSGEECLLHLATASPDIIFMDHMMPGMDGFEAVRAIKERTQLRAIPIVMYTSQSGDMYLGKARALGAVGVLKKPPMEKDLLDILNRVRAENALESGREMVSTPRPQLTIVGADEAGDGTSSVVAGTVVGSAFREPEVRTTIMPPLEAPQPAVSSRWQAILGAGAVVLMLSTMVLGWQLWRQQDVLVDDRHMLVKSLTTLGNQSAEYGFGAIPFDGKRLQQLREVVSILAMTGVSAEIELHAHVGEFCRVYMDMGTVLPIGSVAIESCDLIGYEPAEARQLAMAQSRDFRQYVAQVNEADNGLRINVISVGTDDPLRPYPPASQITLAAEWNGVAARNHRVETRIVLAESML